ncbi:MAG: hypothetical protein BMS9Abin02_0506 [Anaerolineae bacterium]|nr:MAG: hypothetical protein BMS9Abin02_0506 [Anaerolineae bacterium]
MDKNQTRLIIFVVVAFIIGWAIGLFLFGWGIWPVEYTGAGPENLSLDDQKIYLVSLADLYSFDNNNDRVKNALRNWPNAEQAICSFASESQTQAQESRLESLAVIVNNGQGCTGVETIATVEESDGRNPFFWVLVFGLLILLAIVLAAIFLVWQRRGGRSPSAASSEPISAPPSVLEASESTAEQVTPIARFETTYVRGHDTYDDSFSIENIEGDFLGECGVGISDTIGTDSPKSVSAFEVWLFDKNDIRTVTKVIMSDHAFFDDAIKAKLAPKGEPVLGRPNETIVLETASLIVNAEITEMEYGSGTLPPQSFFERFTVELSAWAKEGELEEQSDIRSRVDEMLEF